MSEAAVEQPRCYRKHNVGLNGVLSNPVQPVTHSECTSDQLENRTNNIAMEDPTSAIEHTAHSLRSTTARSRRWDALHIPGDGTNTALELMPRGVTQRTRSRVSRPPHGQGFSASSDERIGREVVVLQKCDEQQSSQQQRSDRDTVIPQPSVGGTSMSPIHHGEVRATCSQAMDVNVSHSRRTVPSDRQGRSVTRDVPYTRVRVASSPRSHARETNDTHSHSREGNASAPRGREANGPTRNGREMSVTEEHGEVAGGRQPCPRLRHRSHVRETNATQSQDREASAPVARGREADSPTRNGREMSVADEHGEAAGSHQPCPRLRRRALPDRGIRRNSTNQEREPYSLRPRGERPNYSVAAGHRRRTQPNWRTQLRTQMRQYMDEIFAAYVNAMLFGNQKREVKDLPEVAINEEQVNSGLKCSVCLLDFVLDEIVHKLPCDHLYHKNCIIPWLEQNDNCPMCRRPVDDDDSDDDDDDDIDILPDDDDDNDDDPGNQRARFRIVVGDADVTVIAHDSANESSASDTDFEVFMNSDEY
ncbi:E3 ubiquitin-protein ligase RNF6-like [Schistocerca americana]|uniref:E3 ubiquitin-protein ligase RNF6-like n=1 Tax=Schistocerca americana TaxID=7009 RepID=UPI001F4F62C9|nr:E3 ubiquitin-protein ligase RNF6-like [Schistocerca americana]XP_046985366.1 E3 ubiquitin-protein ligase RNF6-like [Schistocerca americana]